MQIMNNNQIYKRYVDVVVKIDKLGRQMPLFLLWDNGQKYSIDKVVEIRKTSSRAGGGGLLYRCRIHNQERKLFLERDRWFIESLQP